MRMKEDHMKKGPLKPACNRQISIEEQFITHYSIHQITAEITTLPEHLEGFAPHYGKQSELIVADAEYGSKQNYELMEAKGITAFVKYNYCYMEQKRKHRQDPFSVQNLYSNQQEDFYVCPAGPKLRFIGHSTRLVPTDTAPKWVVIKLCDVRSVP